MCRRCVAGMADSSLVGELEVGVSSCDAAVSIILKLLKYETGLAR